MREHKPTQTEPLSFLFNPPPPPPLAPRPRVARSLIGARSTRAAQLLLFAFAPPPLPGPVRPDRR